MGVTWRNSVNQIGKENLKMYVNPFLAGVVATLLAETLICAVVILKAVWSEVKQETKDEAAEEVDERT